MKKEKFFIGTEKGREEVEGYTHKGLGYFKIGYKDYSVTHLNSGLRIYYAESSKEAKTFITILTAVMDCTLEPKMMLENNAELFKSAMLLADSI